MTHPVDPVETSSDPVDPGSPLTVTSKALDVTEKSSREDDIVHFTQAAKALGVSRKTVERLVKRGTLERVAQGDANVALITKRSLVEELERRRGQAVDSAAIPGLETGHETLPVHSETVDATPVIRTPGEDLSEVLTPLIEQVIEARTRAAVLEAQVRQLEERTPSIRHENEAFTVRANDRLAAALSRMGAALEVQEAQTRRQEQLLSTLVSGSWAARRRARQQLRNDSAAVLSEAVVSRHGIPAK